jgi:hypothetical protein
MIRRWVALGVAQAQKGVRRVKGYVNMPSPSSPLSGPPPRPRRPRRRSLKKPNEPPPLPEVQVLVKSATRRGRDHRRLTSAHTSNPRAVASEGKRSGKQREVTQGSSR